MEQQNTQSERYDYVFRFEDGHEEFCTILISSEAYISDPGISEPYPEWTSTAFQACSGCNCQSSHCPVAVRLVSPLKVFGKYPSYTPVEVTVHAPERAYYKKTDLQDGLRSMFGLLMATSGCPSMDVFRVLARYHLPFASFEENFFRVVSAHALRQYFVERGASGQPLNVEAVNEIYARVGRVNQGMAQRIRQASEQDSGINAVVMWDSMSNLMTYNLESTLEKIKAQLFIADS